MKVTSAIVFTLMIFSAGCADRQGSEESFPTEPAPNQTNADSVLIMQEKTLDRTTSSTGQLIYVPVYSHIYQRDQERTFNLTTTLSIRNTDPEHSFVITRVSYYDSEGKFIENYVDSKETVGPLASTSYVIEERDLRGGVGANFLVNWRSEEPIIPPVIEAVNISTSNQQGISFLSVGRVIKERSSSTESGNN